MKEQLTLSSRSDGVAESRGEKSSRSDGVADSRGEKTSRRGRAPPVDPFDGESADVLFEDWMPGLLRAAEWNDWSEQET